MKTLSRLSPLLLAACLVGALSMGSKASWGAPSVHAIQHEGAPGGGGMSKPADPDEFVVNKARTTRAADHWDQLDDRTWGNGFSRIWSDFGDFIQYVFGPKRPRHL